MFLDALRTRSAVLVGTAALAAVLAACSGGSATTNPAATAPAGASQAAGGTTVSKASTAKGDALVGSNGMTLYVFDKDTTPNKSACAAGQCLSAWPPLTATGTPTAGSGVTGTLATFARDDGAQQVSYNGKPLYFFAADAKPGDTTGDGVGGIWHIAKP